jgi:hypothetical protein
VKNLAIFHEKSSQKLGIFASKKPQPGKSVILPGWNEKFQRFLPGSAKIIQPYRFAEAGQ